MKKEMIEDRSADYARGRVDLEQLEYIYMPPSGSGDPLLSPTLQGVEQIDEPDDRPPFQFNGQILVGVFGGTLVLTPIAYINAKRLGISLHKRILMACVGIFAYFTSYAIAFLTYPYWKEHPIEFVQWLGPHIDNVAMVLVLWFFYSMQKIPLRLYASRNDDFSSMWIPGAIAIAVGYLTNQYLFIGTAKVVTMGLKMFQILIGGAS